jgi:hypothetical protein
MTNELDLQDETRMWDVYDRMQTMVAMLNDTPVFPSLVWLYAWDVVADQFKNHQWEDVHSDGFEDYAIKQGLELHEIWKMFWQDADKNGFTLEYGVEDMLEHITDWMIERDILVSLDNDMDLDEDEDDVIESEEEEV